VACPPSGGVPIIAVVADGPRGVVTVAQDGLTALWGPEVFPTPLASRPYQLQRTGAVVMGKGGGGSSGLLPHL